MLKIGDFVKCTESDVKGIIIQIYETKNGGVNALVLTPNGCKYQAPIYSWALYDISNELKEAKSNVSESEGTIQDLP